MSPKRNSASPNPLPKSVCATKCESSLVETTSAAALISDRIVTSEDYHLKKGDFLQVYSLKPDHVFIILKGVIGFYKSHKLKDRQITHLSFRDSVVGLTTPPQNLELIALDATTIRSFPAAAYKSILTNHPHIALRLIDSLSQELNESQNHSYITGRLSSVASVAAYILFIFEKQEYLSKSSKNTNEVRLVLNRSEIADYLGLTFETVSRSFSTLKNKGVIALSDSKTVEIIDAPYLKSLF